MCCLISLFVGLGNVFDEQFVVSKLRVLSAGMKALFEELIVLMSRGK